MKLIVKALSLLLSAQSTHGLLASQMDDYEKYRLINSKFTHFWKCPRTTCEFDALPVEVTHVKTASAQNDCKSAEPNYCLASDKEVIQV